MERRGLREAIRFIANPYVVLVDLLIALFFIFVLFVHTVRLQEAAAADPRLVRIQEFEERLTRDLVGAWTAGELQDEAEARDAAWWGQLPPETRAVIKRDASLLKLVLLGPTEPRALYRPRATRLEPDAEARVRRLAEILATSEAARALAAERAILSITVEGHTAQGEFATPEESWEASVRRAIQVQRMLEQVGRAHEERLAIPERARLFVPWRFSVVGRGHFLGVPTSAPASPINRRVQIEIRFTSRYDEIQP